MPIRNSAGVTTRELDFSMYASAVSTCTVGMVGGATKGPIGIPTFCSSPTDYERIFGDTLGSEDYGPISAMLFLAKGNSLWYVREDNGSAVQAMAKFSGLGAGVLQEETATVVGTVTSDPTGTVIFTVTSAGMTGSPKAVSVTVAKDDTATQVADKARTALGLDSAIAGKFTIGGTGASVKLTAKVTASNDATLNIAILGAGTGITAAPTSTDTTGGSSGVTVADILTIKYADKGTFGEKYSAKITNASTLDFTLTIYQGNVVKETFATSLDENSTKYLGNKSVEGFEFVIDLQTALSIVNSDKVSLTGGDNGTPLATEDIIGVGNRGLQALSNPNAIDITVLVVPGRFEATIVNEIFRICESRSDCFPIIDPPIGLTPTEVVAYHNGTLVGTDYPEAALNTSYGAIYYPWVKVTNPSTAQSEWIPPSGVVAGAFAVNDDLASPWFAPAGLTRGRLNQVLAVERDLSETETDLLYGNDNAVNPIINFRRQGFVIWGQRTLQREDTSLDRINVRRLMLYIRKIVSVSSAYLVFEQNDQTTWDKWVRMVEPTLESIKRGRGLYEYKVQMDSSTVTPAHIDRNEMPGRISLRPTKTAEFVFIDFVLKSTGASFE